MVTWNMHAGRGDLRRLVDDLASGRLSGRAPDDYLLLLQEAIEGGPGDVVALARDRGLFAFYSPVRKTSDGVSGNAMLSTLPLIEPHPVELPRVRQSRQALAAHVDLHGMRVAVVNAHLENRVTWFRGGLLSESGRARQVDALLETVPKGEPAIVGGDFNTWLGRSESAWKKLAARFPQTPQPNTPTFRGRLMLDHLFADVPEGWTITQAVLADSYGSDHSPVLAVLLTAASAATGAPSTPSRRTSP